MTPPRWFFPVLILWVVLLLPVGSLGLFGAFLFDGPENEGLAWLVFLAWLSLPLSFAAAPIGMWIFQSRGNERVVRRFAVLPLLHVLALIGVIAVASAL